MEEREDGHVDVRCNECGEMKQGRLTSTGNYYTHYRLKHPSKLKEIEEYSRKPSTPVDQPQAAKKRQPTITESITNASYFILELNSQLFDAIV